jgi:hypothetical protein
LQSSGQKLPLVAYLSLGEKFFYKHQNIYKVEEILRIGHQQKGKKLFTS